MPTKADESGDALDSLELQDEIIRDLYRQWDHGRAQLEHGDSVNVRWEKGSAAKLVLQHVAVRESAKEAVAGRLREINEHALADRMEGEGVFRRRAIDRCDELIRGHQAITVNGVEIDTAMADLEGIVLGELAGELREIVPEAKPVLGSSGERGLPSARHIRTHSTTHPSPEARWYDKVGPFKALRALYDHLRTSPRGGTRPGLDNAREYDPNAQAEARQ